MITTFCFLPFVDVTRSSFSTAQYLLLSQPIFPHSFPKGSNHSGGKRQEYIKRRSARNPYFGQINQDMQQERVKRRAVFFYLLQQLIFFFWIVVLLLLLLVRRQWESVCVLLSNGNRRANKVYECLSFPISPDQSRLMNRDGGERDTQLFGETLWFLSINRSTLLLLTLLAIKLDLRAEFTSLRSEREEKGEADHHLLYSSISGKKREESEPNHQHYLGS